MKIIKAASIVSLVFIVLAGCVSHKAADLQPVTETFKTPQFSTLDDALDYLGTELSKKLPDLAGRDFNKGDKATVIAIADFITVDEKVTRFSRYVADKLTPYFVRSKNFSVLERALIEKVIEEHEFQASPFVDEDSTLEFGKLLGAETIIAGTISELSNAFYINAKAVGVAQGNIITSMDVEIKKTGKMILLYNAELPHLRKKKIKTKIFRAQGIGIPSPKHKNPALARALAFRAAKGVAMRDLIEQIQSTNITSDTTIKDMVAQDDNIRIQLNSSLQGARVVNQRQLADGTVEVEMEVELTEDFIRALSSN